MCKYCEGENKDRKILEDDGYFNPVCIWKENDKAFPKKKYEFKCPKCVSKDIYTYKRGFKTGRFILGSMFLGALDGTILGLIGKDKIKHKCLCCGKEWNGK